MSGYNGVKRSRFSAFGYHAADEQRTSGRATPYGGSGDRHDRYDRKLLRDMSQAFDRDNPILNAVISRACDNIVGHGFNLQMNTGDEKLDLEIQSRWKAWWKNPEVRKLDRGWQVERSTLASVMRDGDIAAIKLFSGDFQMIESERIDRPGSYMRNAHGRVEDGIQLGERGEPLGAWVCDYSDSGMVQVQKGQFYDWAKLVFVANRRRLSQTRGMPAGIPVFPMIHRLSEVLDAEAVAWQILSRFAVAINRKGGPEQAYNESTELEGLPSNVGKEERPERSTDVGHAILFHGEPGEELKGIERNIPGANFPDAVRMFLRLIGMPFGMPLELLLLDFSQTNYSSAKASLEQAYRAFKAWQRLLWENFHDPLLEWKLAEWYGPELLEKANHKWLVPEFPWLDPLKEAQAAGLSMALGLQTHSQAIAGRGGDRDDWLRERQKEYVSAYQVQQNVLKATDNKVNIPIELLVGLNDKILAEAVKSEVADKQAASAEDSDSENEGAE